MARPHFLRATRLLPALLGVASIAQAQVPAPASSTAGLNSPGANAAAVDAMAKMRLALQNDPAEILARYLRTLADNPMDLPALTGAGRAALAIGDANAALAFFARAEAIAPRDGRIKAGLGSALLQLEKPKEAIRLFDDATDLGVPDTEVAADRGLAWDLRGDPGRAQKDYALALKARRDDETVRRMALSLAISGQGEAGTALLDPLLRRQDRAAWRARAFILAMEGKVADADVVARSGMSTAQVMALHPFLVRLAALKPAQKALAVNFGEMPSDGRSYTSRDLAMLDGGAARPQPRPESKLIPAGQPFGAQPMEALPSGPWGLSLAATRRPAEPVRLAEAGPGRPPAKVADAPAQAVAKPDAPPPARVQIAAVTPAARTSAPVPFGIPGEAAAPAPAPSAAAAPPAETSAAAGATVAPPLPATAPASVPPQPASIGSRLPPAVYATAPREVAGPPASLAQVKAPPAVLELDPSITARAREEEAARLAATSASTPSAAPPTPIAAAAAGDTAPAAGQPREAPAPALASAAPGAAPAAAAATEVPPARPEARPVVKSAAPSIEPAKPTIESKSADAKAAEAKVVTKSRAETASPARDKAKAAAERTQVADKTKAGDKANPDGKDDAKAKSDPKAKAKSDDKTAKADKDAKPDGGKNAKEAKPAKDDDKDAKPDRGDAKSAKDAPERVWVQVAGGASKADLPKAWSKLKPKAPGLAKGQSTWTTPLRFTNRLLVGPFKDADDAQAYVNRMGKAGLSGFVFTSDKGQEVEKLSTGK